MNLFTRLAVLFYVMVVLLVGLLMVFFVLNWINLENIMNLFHIMSQDNDFRLTIGIIGIILLLMNFLFYRSFAADVDKDRTIAFDNPSGRVSVSVVALEDLVKRMILRLSDAKDVKTKIAASRRGLQIKIRLMLSSAVNIPEETANIQDLIRKKVQDIIGIEETVNISIYVSKIISTEGKGKSHKEQALEEKSEPNIPFQGYRA